ncbi:Response regulator receiver domain-containing protein [Arboricoccus pini]|uniref:Response regulator receiver domain-containing protein n=1 Tax=Arboricoccus pini TaxID=1963835 RepID=A0A212QY96_9PROT|nr:response regulator [Arboricoccus pini]SNB64513.1 Response regulator receiver domain-containing protein [Arboricoccus pini]
MSSMHDVTREIASEVPFMRRFARAVLGSQAIADDQVKEALQRLLNEREPIERLGVKVALFRALNATLKLACAPSNSQTTYRTEGHAVLDSRLSGLLPLGRHLLLLTTLEGFSLGDAAQIVDLSLEDAGLILGEAKESLRRQPATRILIIEDEPVIALDISSTVSQSGHTVVGIATTHKEAVEMARSGNPGLVLADIQLADDSSGLEAVQEILSEVTLPVIFVTAYPERLLTGERPEPAFLITKPFDDVTLNVTIAQALTTASLQGKS